MFLIKKVSSFSKFPKMSIVFPIQRVLDHVPKRDMTALDSGLPRLAFWKATVICDLCLLLCPHWSCMWQLFLTMHIFEHCYERQVKNWFVKIDTCICYHQVSMKLSRSLIVVGLLTCFWMFTTVAFIDNCYTTICFSLYSLIQ